MRGVVSLGGSKRIFRWNGEDGKFDAVKVPTAEQDQYETHADIRLYAGMVRSLVCIHSLILTRYSPLRAGSSTDLGDGKCVLHPVVMHYVPLS